MIAEWRRQVLEGKMKSMINHTREDQYVLTLDVCRAFSPTQCIRQT